MNFSEMLPLVADVALVGGALLGLSVALYALLRRVLPRVFAALVAPLVAMLAGCLYAGISLVTLRQDGDALHLMMLLPPFVFGLVFPVIAMLLVWVFATRPRS